MCASGVVRLRGENAGGERYFPCVNISGEPEAYFRMSPEDWLRAEMQGEIVALVHSHPGGLPWLSEADRRLQVQSDLPWWLVCRVRFINSAVCRILRAAL
ncbi:putative tail fiber component K of prophage [Escherichia coli]|uniref:Putative tail fiber component K of prophage n=1 Tax=Escherichia coli TaxID=562 RepID=A0A376P572_ECOLX|nr:putative tail fiber component K of prophage [Escherichia coli]